jgi:hypothetical protein
MTAKGTIGGQPPVDKICRNCKDWSIGGNCGLWKQYKYALHVACGYFTPREIPGNGKQTKTAP